VIRLLRLAATLYLLVVLQTLLVPQIRIGGAAPDLPLLFVLLVAFHEGAAGGAICGFVAGLFVDVNASGVLGLTSLANSVTAFGVGAVADRLVRGSVITRVLVAFVATVVRDQLLVVLQAPGGFGAATHLFLTASLPAGLYTGLVAPVVMGVTGVLAGWGRERRHGSR
jgi:rod shape-determining protein MreD